MKEACLAITRGGVTYRIPKAAERGARFDWLRIGDRSHRLAEPVRAENSNCGAARDARLGSARTVENTLDLSDDDDLRAGALLAVLCAGVRKNELCGLDVGDLREGRWQVALSVRRLRPPSRAKQPPGAAQRGDLGVAATLLGASALDAATVRRAVCSGRWAATAAASARVLRVTPSPIG